MSLQINNWSVNLQEKKILKKINLEIKEGELISLLGPSGCGKTTLLKSIAGLLENKTGTIYVYGREITKLPPEQRNTVIVFQDLRLFPHLTVEKNIAFGMELKKIPKKEQKEKIRELLAEVQLSGLGKRKIRQLSGGQMQRVALVRALAAEPKILLLDEPFSGLDETLRREMGMLVQKLQREKKITTILVTHDSKEALQMSDRIAVMMEGEVLQYDTPWNVFAKPFNRQTADYFGGGNYLEGIVKAGVFSSPLFTCQTEREDGRYEAFLRPGAISVKEGEGPYEIEEILFQGEYAQIRLLYEDRALLSSCTLFQLNERQLKKGDKVGIRIDESQVFLFPLEGGAKDEKNTV